MYTPSNDYVSLTVFERSFIAERTVFLHCLSSLTLNTITLKGFPEGGRSLEPSRLERHGVRFRESVPKP